MFTNGVRDFQRGVLLAVACFTPALLNASSLGACPTTVIEDVTFPAGGSYLCQETDNIWLNFFDYGGSGGITPLPPGTIFHIDTVVPDEVAITLEPSLSGQFVAGDTYEYGYGVVEDAFSNPPIVAASSDFGAEGAIPTLTTTVTELDVSSYNADGSPNTSLAATLGTLTNTNGALQSFVFGPVLGVQFTNTITVIGSDTTIQSLSNDIEEAPEPDPAILGGLGILLLGLGLRRRAART